MFDQTAEFYDALYSWKDYDGECERIREIVAGKSPDARSLLDVACGTGKHLSVLKEHFDVRGLDIEEGLVEIARERLGDIEVYQGDMVDFDLDQTFDVVCNLFSSIGYVVTPERLSKSLAAMARHLAPGGVMLVEPWFTPDQWLSGHIGVLDVETDDGTKVVRMMTGTLEDGVTTLQAEYLIGRGEEITRRSETHVLGLFTIDTYLEAFDDSDLDVEWDPEGLMGRGLFIATR